ncbi:MAG: ribose 5-phosphate isomerase B [Planctomycetota bacterium]
MKIIIGSDHAAFKAKEELLESFRMRGYEVMDAGTLSEDSCDYPDFAEKVALAVRAHEESDPETTRGILLCGTGIGMSIAANRFKGIRAALCHSTETAKLSRAHNNSNILCMGARILDRKTLIEIAHMWIKTSFEGGRHAMRLDKIDRFEKE